MALSIQFTAPTVKTLREAWQRALARGDRRPVQRITALQMVGQRQPIPTVAAVVGVAESTLYGWVSAWLLRGSASLVYRTSPGRPTKLTKTQKARLGEWLDAGPEAAGFAYGAWSAPLVQALIERELGSCTTFIMSATCWANSASPTRKPASCPITSMRQRGGAGWSSGGARW